jgi:nucleoside-diphosphate-sugar epimerase
MQGETILITGGAGYIGVGVIAALLRQRQRIVCLDSLMFGGGGLIPWLDHPNFEFEHADIRDENRVLSILNRVRPTAIVHLAAIVGDPACSQQPDVATAVNWEASRFLADAARQHGVERFVFASTCSNYGKMSDHESVMDEMSPLAPVSLYAELKVRTEQYLLSLQNMDKNFAPTCLRFATVYGLAPRMRFDLTVNEFARDAALGRELVVFGEQFWRPYCHVRDFARAIEATLAARFEEVAYQTYNVGDSSENYTKSMLVDLLRERLPELRISFVTRNEDPRDYRVNCDRIKERLGFAISRTVADGIDEIVTAVQAGVFPDPDQFCYSNSAGN